MKIANVGCTIHVLGYNHVNLTKYDFEYNIQKTHSIWMEIEKQQKAFEILRDILCFNIILQQPDFS